MLLAARNFLRLRAGGAGSSLFPFPYVIGGALGMEFDSHFFTGLFSLLLVQGARELSNCYSFFVAWRAFSLLIEE
jgi:hypothetical protein